MADDSDADSWDSKQDEFSNPAPKTDPPSNPLENYQNGIRRRSNGLDSGPRHYHRQETRKSSPRGLAEVRFINPAIYAESLTPSNNGDCIGSTSTDDGSTIVVEVRCGDSNALTQGFSSLSIADETPRSSGAGDRRENLDTYRCNRSDETSRTTSTLTLTNNSRSVTRLVRRCIINGSSESTEKKNADAAEEDDVIRRFSSNGRRVVQFSSTSLSSSSSYSENCTSGLSLARKIAHKEWAQKKERDAKRRNDIERRGELGRHKEEEKIERERLERERKERDNFSRWQERKKREEISRRLSVERELELQRRLKTVEDHASVAKIIHLKQWAKKKEETFKAQQKEQELKRKTIAEERRKRLEESSQAFERWRESAKSRPKPATQGLLPHQRAKPSFVNPKPWQQIVDVEQIESQNDLSSENKPTEETNNTVGRIITLHQ